MSRRWGVAAAFAAAVIFTGAVQARIDTAPKALRAGAAWVPLPEVADLLAMGFEAVVADLHWIRAVQIAGEEDTDPTEYAPVLGRLVDVVTHLDPWVDHPYRFAAIWMTDSEESVREANRLLERGIAHHPDDWRMYFHKGFNHFFYLEEDEQAAVELERAMNLPGAPRYLPRLVARLRSESRNLDAAAMFLQEMVQRAPDELSRSQYQAALDEIEVERAARFLDRARQAYRELTGRDIERVEDLLTGDHPILRALPPAEPRSVPAALRRGSSWEIDPASGQIQSSYYGHRYEVNFHPLEQKRRDEWRARREARSHEGATDVR